MTTFPMLEGPSREPASGGPAKQLVVLLHGFGADGDDLIGLAPQFARILPDAAFLSPNAPFAADTAPYGRQWFSLKDRSPAHMMEGANVAKSIIDRFLDLELEKRKLSDAQLALVGFSQGTMTALHVGLRRVAPCAGILGYSGVLVGAETLGDELRVRPPVMLIHGDDDPVVPFNLHKLSLSTLEALDVPVEGHVRPGLGHWIDEEGLRLGMGFLQRIFGVSA
ncbi:MAG TPA: alpha/beta fold hydrolase [Alphaproteobacteria bacterium]|jgi:phospholipase/carboxylesterase